MMPALLQQWPSVCSLPSNLFSLACVSQVSSVGAQNPPAIISAWRWVHWESVVEHMKIALVTGVYELAAGEPKCDSCSTGVLKLFLCHHCIRLPAACRPVF